MRTALTRRKLDGRRTRLRRCAVAIAVACCAAGCKPRPATSVPRPEESAVAFIGAGQDDPLWPVLRAGAERYIAEFGIRRVFVDAPRFTSPVDQIEMLRRLPQEGYRGVCVQVSAPELIAPVVRQLCSAGLRITTMVHDTAQDVRAAFCGVDNVAIGRQLAQAAARVLSDAGSLIVLHAGQEHASYADRLWAFRQAMEVHPQIKCYFWLDCKGDPAEAERLIRSYLERYPHLGAVVALDDWPLRFLEGKPRLLPTGCKLITVGGNPAYWKFLQDGTCGALVEADHSATGYDALMLCDKATRNQAMIVKRIELPLTIVTAGDSLERFMVDWVAWSAPPAE